MNRIYHQSSHPIRSRLDPFFFLPDQEELELVKEGAALPSSFFNTGRRAWIAQTYIELSEIGVRVCAGGEPPRVGAIFFHRSDYEELVSRFSWGARPTLVCVRADKDPLGSSHMEIVQNGRAVKSSRQLFIPHWPQRGIIPREKNRGSTMEFATYKGSAYELHPALLEDWWVQELGKRGIRWICRPQPKKIKSIPGYENDWHDYSKADVLVALRPKSRGDRKPATKLINAWLAGTPAVLGEEPQYDELREGPADFLSANSPEAALEAIDKLIENPDLYEKMQQSGLKRAREFDFPATRSRWVNLLNGLSSRPSFGLRDALWRMDKVKHG